MTRSADKPNRISQTAHDLEAGRAYCLQFVTADLKDVTGKNYNPRRYGIDAALEGAEILGDKAAPGEELIINFIQLKPYLE